MSECKEFLYVLRPTRLEMLTEGATHEEARIVSEHFNYLKELLDEDVVVLMGRTQEDNEETLGLVILRAETETEARKVMENDPAVKHGVMHARLYPYRIALMARS